ncbi:hypothetical protein BN14_10473 [Rhizoctonia solani AG-1 IB]|uniref:DUF6535 domain-containing protein n=1 Tax=Thanatephorus cucumeris (strain AG1-IB / isolate 7/3/14) TaxID=1108050 RepID=M5CAI9_THACB|nr:hypothetical protein BN14_10473 [Rhizoctonia solani AG-1 IB]
MRVQVPDREINVDATTTTNIDQQAANTTNYNGFDEYGAELGPDARVWKAYVKEADKFDMDSLDVTLIFAALFTAICTAFVIEGSKSLKEDPPERSANRLDQITNILLVIAEVASPSQLNVTKMVNPEPFSPRPIDLCLRNGVIYSCLVESAIPGPKQKDDNSVGGE